MRKLLLMPLLLCFAAVAQAAQPIKITWQDLQGQVEPYEDPFADLTADQTYNLSIYGYISEIKKSSPDKVTEEMEEEAAAAKAQLIAENIDIDYLFKQRLIIIEKRKKAALITNDLLADRQIQMAGYMLALEFDNGLVTEFLLVPTIGACSHKPVPPANQLIFVKAQKAIAAGSPYMPVQVTGTLRITPQAKDLYLVDGERHIEMAYSLEDTKVEPFIATH
ncbi:DUF3299 domain-containing protein [Psychromonas algarum]|uniref:DUF3299 domain-containing protein n=1 Tax=Psychromonas algarum TaxID=2555643 RepID=UPI0014199B01|nr:DUF3299 domain-containing protein [Psychromonas sp. RZ22]